MTKYIDLNKPLPGTVQCEEKPITLEEIEVVSKLQSGETIKVKNLNYEIEENVILREVDAIAEYTVFLKKNLKFWVLARVTMVGRPDKFVFYDLLQKKPIGELVSENVAYYRLINMIIRLGNELPELLLQKSNITVGALKQLYVNDVRRAIDRGYEPNARSIDGINRITKPPKIPKLKKRNLIDLNK